MKTAIILLALAVVGLLWLRHENSNLRTSFEKANRVATEQKTEIGMLKNQLSVASSRADRNEQAHVELREKLNAAGDREAAREKLIKRLLNENDDFKNWYGADLPDAVSRLHRRAACPSASDCLQWLSESQPLPYAGERPKN